MAAVEPVVGIEKGDGVGAAGDRMIAADQAGRVAIILVVTPQDDMRALERLDSCRFRAVTNQDVVRRNRLLTHTVVRLLKPCGFGPKVRRDDADLHKWRLAAVMREAHWPGPGDPLPGKHGAPARTPITMRFLAVGRDS